MPGLAVVGEISVAQKEIPEGLMHKRHHNEGLPTHSLGKDLEEPSA